MKELTAQQHLEKLGWAGQHYRQSLEWRNAAVLAAHQAGISSHEIGRAVGLSHEGVRQMLKRDLGEQQQAS